MLMFNLNIKLIVSILVTTVLLFIIVNHFFKDLFKLNPFYRNKILLEGFDASGNDMSKNNASVNDASGNAPVSNASVSNAPVSNAPVSNAPVSNDASGNDMSKNNAPVSNAPVSNAPVSNAPVSNASAPSIPDTDKSTIMVDLFEKVNNQMDIIRTIKLSDKFIPINIDKTASEPFAILMNLKLLINNGIYKNEMDLKEMYNKYIGNKAIQVLTSDINSVNMESSINLDIGNLESSFLTRCQSIVAAHQTVIDKILENQSKE